MAGVRIKNVARARLGPLWTGPRLPSAGQRRLPGATADILAWDRDRGEPPLRRGFSPAEEQALLAQLDR